MFKKISLYILQSTVNALLYTGLYALTSEFFPTWNRQAVEYFWMGCLVLDQVIAGYKTFFKGE